jgi:predicted O-linked N-acetylglucosamine transferase (SPINDLY family)
MALGQSDSQSQMLNRAIALHQRGQLTDAEKLYRDVLRARPNHVEARHFLGILRFQQGRADEALALIAAALDAKPDYPEAHYNRGNILAALSRFNEAIANYDAAIALHPAYVDAHHNRGNALLKLRHFDQALGCYDRALSIAPLYAPAWNGRGTALNELRYYAEALDCFDRTLEIVPDQPDALYNRGNTLNELKRSDEALACYLKARKLYPHHPDRFGGLDAALAVCDFGSTNSFGQGLVEDLSAGNASVPPYLMLVSHDDPALHLQAAKNFVAGRILVWPQPLWTGERYRHERIKVAYLSADFREHPIALLIAELLELHDRNRFEIHAVSFGRDDGSPMRARIAKGCEHFHDVQGASDEAIAQKMRELEIDIAVDLMGFTKYCRPEIFACRPAPIHVGYLGYPGTVGAPLLDYILVDETVVPSGQAAFYSEARVELPFCFLVNDRSRVVPAPPTRQEAGLPGQGTVFCCFNNSRKIREPVFDVWMRILSKVPDSVLWLRLDNATAGQNLRTEAAARNVDPKRLVFADRVPEPADHLARHQLADLFLDTVPYNAHTTASDALWAGVPVVTCLGNAFAGRVAASLLNAIGLPELVTHHLADYEALALRLATDPEALQAVRVKLVANRLTQPPFDTDRFRRNIETAYLRMWETWQRGEAAQEFRVEPAA